LIFLFVAEDRTLDGLPLLHPRDGSDPARTARERFALHYGTARLREMAAKIKGSRHSDLWRQFQIIVGALSGDASFTGTREALALPALGSFLWDPSSTTALNAAELTNHDFLEALRDLAFTRQGEVLRPVDYENLGAEELGGVYESLLALTPQISADGSRFTFAEFAGNERKTSGSYYTPDSLVQCLLDSALDPVVDEAIKGKSGSEAEKVILALKVCDPAVGSGHFLVGAAHRLALHLARVRAVAQGESEPSPLLYQHSLRDVIGHCLYGVDINPMAAELCRVSLWLEALDPGKPLSFLEHRIKCGNSLLGTTPALLAKGIPDEAFIYIEGDDKEICKQFKRVNKDERNRQMRLFAATTEPWQQLGNLAVSLANLDSIDDNILNGVREKQKLYEQTIRSADYLSGRFWADTWCAAFVWQKTRKFSYPITEEVFRRIEHNPHAVDPWMRDEIQRLAALYQFFHWHLAFPDVFHVPQSDAARDNEQSGWTGGFDCILGNPPWEKIKLQEREFFAIVDPAVAVANTAADRKRLIQRHRDGNTDEWKQYKTQLELDAKTSHFCRNSGCYPLTGAGEANTYSLFAEASTRLVARTGYIGLILKTGIVNAVDNVDFYQAILASGRLRSVRDFKNWKGWFPDVGYHERFSLVTCGGYSEVHRCTYAFNCVELEDAFDSTRVYELTEADVRLMNPNIPVCPVFSTVRDVGISKTAYLRFAPLVHEVKNLNPWNLQYLRMFDMTSDSDAFLTLEQLTSRGSSFDHTRSAISGSDIFIPLLEGKHIHSYSHRFGTFDEVPAHSRFGIKAAANAPTLSQLRDPSFEPLPRYWVSNQDFVERCPNSIIDRQWCIAFRDVTNLISNARTTMAAIVPARPYGNSAALLYSEMQSWAEHATQLLGLMGSVPFDFFARQKMFGAHLNKYILWQLPCPSPDQVRAFQIGPLGLDRFVLDRVVELVYVAWSLQRFGSDCGDDGPPYIWDTERRFLIRSELDAAYFHLYGISRDDIEYIMGTFPIVKRKEEEKYDGDFRTKRVILEIYDAMQESIRRGQPYQTRLDPPPADLRCRHPKPKVGILAFGSIINDPGDELKPRIIFRLKTRTPFPIEYGRYSGKTRGGAPTLVPHQIGSPVAAEILVLDEMVTIDDATNMLWRRETRQTETEIYAEGASPNSVLVRRFNDDPRVSTILYTNFHDAGKTANPTARELAEHAIHSVEAAAEGMDGITYLINAIKCGIETPLTPGYRDEILRQTNTPTLEEALRNVKEEVLGRRNAGQHE
jgi:hypothetical protein